MYISTSVHKKKLIYLLLLHSSHILLLSFIPFFSSSLFSQSYYRDSSLYLLPSFKFSYNPNFLSFFLYLVTYPPPIISMSQNILPSFHIATVPLIAVMFEECQFSITLFPNQYSNAIPFNY